MTYVISLVTNITHDMCKLCFITCCVSTHFTLLSVLSSLLLLCTLYYNSWDARGQAAGHCGAEQVGEDRIVCEQHGDCSDEADEV